MRKNLHFYRFDLDFPVSLKAVSPPLTRGAGRFKVLLATAALFAACFFAMPVVVHGYSPLNRAVVQPIEPGYKSAPVAAPFIPVNPPRMSQPSVCNEKYPCGGIDLPPSAVPIRPGGSDYREAVKRRHEAQTALIRANQAAQNSKKINSAVKKIDKQRRFLLGSAIASGLVGGYLLKTQCCPSSAPCSVPDAGGGGGGG